MKDLFGNTAPVQIELNEWWFNGRIIQKQGHPSLPSYVSFPDEEEDSRAIPHHSKQDAIEYAIKNPCVNPKNFPDDYLR